MSLPIFSFLPLAVYPVGVTIYWCYFSWIFIYNFVTIYGIATKFGIRSALIPPFNIQISKQSDNAFVFYDNFYTLTKRRKKTKKLSQFSKVHAWRDLVEIWNVRWWRWTAFPLQKSVGFVEVSRSYICVKIALFFFLLITHGCGAPTSWAAQHYHVSW